MSKDTMTVLKPFLQSEGLIFYKNMRMEQLVDAYPKAVAIYNLIQKHFNKSDNEPEEVTNMDLKYLGRIESANTRLEVELIFIMLIHDMKEMTTRAIVRMYESKGFIPDEDIIRKQVYAEVESGYQPSIDMAIAEYFS